MKSKSAKRAARRRVEAEERGLCNKCFTKVAGPGLKKCKWCIDVDNFRKQNYVKDGRCQTCGRDKFGETQKNCMLCRRSKTERGDDNQWS